MRPDREGRRVEANGRARGIFNRRVWWIVALFALILLTSLVWGD